MTQHSPSSPRRLAILTSGGDAPGMNAAIRAASMVAFARGWEVLGVQNGYQGLMQADWRPLAPADVGGVVRDGGTLLGSVRSLAFMQRAGRDAARRAMAEAGVGGLVVIGGNGSLTGALALSDDAGADPPAPAIVGVPASIDNDVGLTALSIGVDTAMNTIVQACDKISDTASAHGRTFIVEVMGRDCGYLAMTAGVAAGADAVLFPEAGRSDEDVVEAMVATIRAARQREGRGNRVLVIKSEGVGISSEALKRAVDARMAQEGQAQIETRVTILGHTVRGGRPSAFDRVLASRMGYAAVQAIFAGETNKMIGWSLGSAPEGIATRSPADPHCWLVDLRAALAETARLLDGSSPVVRWRRQVFDEIEGVLRL